MRGISLMNRPMHKLMAAAASLCGLLPALTLAQNVGQGGPNALPNLELAAKTSDALPKSRDALFDDDDMTSSPSSAPSAPATPAPGKKESLFLDDQPAAAPAKPATTAATDSG